MKSYIFCYVFQKKNIMKEKCQKCIVSRLYHLTFCLEEKIIIFKLDKMSRLKQGEIFVIDI